VVVGAAAVGAAAACLDPRAGPVAEAGPDLKHGRQGGLVACRGLPAVVEAGHGRKGGRKVKGGLAA
jgi:hypothetical protein